MRKFHRTTGPRRSFLRALANNLINKERVLTTEARAKAIRPLVEKLVTIAKKQQLYGLRILIARLNNKDVAQKLFYSIAPRYQKRAGGYLRIIKQGKVRKRDAAKTAVIEFV
jgi:large subunit ribosomal protein L17